MLSFLLRSCRRPRAQRQSRCLTRTFPLGGRASWVGQARPRGLCCAYGGNSPPDQSGAYRPSAADGSSLTPANELSRGARAAQPLETRRWSSWRVIEEAELLTPWDIR